MKSTIQLVDLAGSETEGPCHNGVRQKEANGARKKEADAFRRKETMEINTSILELGIMLTIRSKFPAATFTGRPLTKILNSSIGEF